jgi:hypothetical protein
MSSAEVVAICVVPSVLFRINPFGNDDSLSNEPVSRSVTGNYRSVDTTATVRWVWL